MAEIATPIPESRETKEELDEDALIEMRRWIKAKKVGLKPESKDYQGLDNFDTYVERRLREIAWKKYKGEKRIE